MVSKPCAHVLEWWLREQDKFIGASVRTRQVGDQYELYEWKVDGVAKPTDKEIEKIIIDYEAQYVEPKTDSEKIDDLETRIKVLEG